MAVSADSKACNFVLLKDAVGPPGFGGIQDLVNPRVHRRALDRKLKSQGSVGSGPTYHGTAVCVLKQLPHLRRV